MKKKLLRWCLPVLIFSLLLLGCRNEDFYKGSYNSAREEDFFRDAEKLTSRLPQSKEIIDLLKNENERSHFISKMIDQKGLPVWRKIVLKKPGRIAGKGEDDPLEIVIPLTEDQKTLSSLLFVTETSGGSLLISNANNELLKHIIFDQSISATERENYLLNFILADRGVFGTSKYINIPDDLLKDIPVNQENGLKSLEIESTTVDNDNPQNAASGMICIDIITPNPGCGSCDYPPIIKTICFLVYNPDTGGDGGGSGGGTGGGGGGGTGGGGGGGTPNPGGNNPDDDGGSNDPCYNRAFYRVPTSNLPCDIQMQVSPCEKAKEPAKMATLISQATTVKPNLDLLKSHAATKNVEYGVTISTQNNNLTSTPPYTTGQATSVTIVPPSTGDYIANAHSHPTNGAPPPSPPDIYAMLETIAAYNTFQMSFVFAYNGATYAFVINNRAQALQFLAKYPPSTNLNGKFFTKISDIGIKFNDIYDGFTKGTFPLYSGTTAQNDGLETAMAYILSEYNSGISLTKMDANGNLKGLKTSTFDYEIPYSGGKHVTAYRTDMCP